MQATADNEQLLASTAVAKHIEEIVKIFLRNIFVCIANFCSIWPVIKLAVWLCSQLKEIFMS
jgi:hypothetical protein